MIVTTILCLMPFCLIGWLVWKDRDKSEGRFCEYDDLDNTCYGLDVTLCGQRIEGEMKTSIETIGNMIDLFYEEDGGIVKNVKPERNAIIAELIDGEYIVRIECKDFNLLHDLQHKAKQIQYMLVRQ